MSLDSKLQRYYLIFHMVGEEVLEKKYPERIIFIELELGIPSRLRLGTNRLVNWQGCWCARAHQAIEAPTTTIRAVKFNQIKESTRNLPFPCAGTSCSNFARVGK